MKITKSISTLVSVVFLVSCSGKELMEGDRNSELKLNSVSEVTINDPFGRRGSNNGGASQ